MPQMKEFFEENHRAVASPCQEKTVPLSNLLVCRKQSAPICAICGFQVQIGSSMLDV
jgi:hypothetical protein